MDDINEWGVKLTGDKHSRLPINLAYDSGGEGLRGKVVEELVILRSELQKNHLPPLVYSRIREGLRMVVSESCVSSMESEADSIIGGRSYREISREAKARMMEINGLSPVDEGERKHQ